jgi:hypothetical protein
VNTTSPSPSSCLHGDLESQTDLSSLCWGWSYNCKRFQALGNCNEAVRLCKSPLGLSLVGIAGSDLYDGNRKATLSDRDVVFSFVDGSSSVEQFGS